MDGDPDVRMENEEILAKSFKQSRLSPARGQRGFLRHSLVSIHISFGACFFEIMVVEVPPLAGS